MPVCVELVGWLVLGAVTEDLCQTPEVEAFRILERLFPFGKVSPIRVSTQDSGALALSPRIFWSCQP